MSSEPSDGSPDSFAWKRGGHERLSPPNAEFFAGSTLFDAVGRTLCEASCLPRKELYESWEVARRVLRRHRGGPIVDLAGGHGLVGWFMAMQDPRTTTVRVIDTRIPPSAQRIYDAFAPHWPRVAERVAFIEGRMQDAEVTVDTRVLGVHACGGLTDAVLDIAITARARVAVLPCCHSHNKQDDGGLSGWMPTDVAIDATRAARLRSAGYRVWTTTIPEDITPKNRVLIASPTAESAGR